MNGGFAGTETARSERDWVAHPTILSGDLNDNGRDDNDAYHVVTGSGADASAVLDGFTVTGGNANGSDPDNCGGGMDNWGGSSTVINVTFSGNAASFYGGGGMDNSDDSSPTLIDVTFSGNSAYVGGGMHNDYYSSPTLTDVTFSANSASGGGGMSNWDSSNPTLTNVTFTGNSASYGGGGGMLNILSSSPTLTNVTFSGNNAVWFSGGMHNSNSSPTLTNCILWGNSAPQIFNVSSTPTVTYSDVQGGYAGTGNIDADPLFVVPVPTSPMPNTGGDLRLHATSPAVDAGDNSAPGLSGITTDLDGNPRIIGAAVDMGAYEAPPAVTSITIVKEADPADGTDFSFDGDGGLGSFVLDDAELDDTDGVADSITFAELPSGTYAVAEQPLLDWKLDDIACDTNDPNDTTAVNVAGGSVEIDLDHGETITCTFFNGQKPTAITLASFTAQAGGGSVALAWETGTEVDNAGFNLYRAAAEGGPYTRVNGALIAAEGDPVSGASYSFLDKGLSPGTYFYKLEDVDLTGTTTLHGPVSAAVLPRLRRPPYRPTLP